MTKKSCFAVKYSLKNHDCGHLVDTIQRINFAECKINGLIMRLTGLDGSVMFKSDYNINSLFIRLK